MYPYLHIGSLTLWSLGLMMGVGLSLGYLFGEADFKRRGVPIPMGVFLPAMAVAGLVGGKLDHAIVVQRYTLKQNPLAIDWVSTLWGGYTGFGALIGGMLAAVLLANIYKTPVLRVLDAIPVCSLGFACGRLGCFLAGDGDYGIPTSLPWGMSFPHGIVPTVAPVHPTPLYEAAYSLALFIVLWRRGRPENYARTWQGSQLALFLFWTGLCRFFVEFFSRHGKVFAGLKESQLVAIVFILIAAALRLFHAGTAEQYAGGRGATDANSATGPEGGALPEGSVP